LKIIQHVIDLIHPVGLGFLSEGIAYSDRLQIKQVLPTSAHQKIRVSRDPKHIRMKLDLETATKKEMVEKQLEDCGPVLSFNRRPKTLLEIKPFFFWYLLKPLFE
jgi:hypothetical protein